MTEHNEPGQSRDKGPSLPPPSFTPAAGRPQRPKRTPAIEVGSPDTGPQATRNDAGSYTQPQTNSQPIVAPRVSSRSSSGTARAGAGAGSAGAGSAGASGAGAGGVGGQPASFAPAARAQSQQPAAIPPRTGGAAQPRSIQPTSQPGTSQPGTAQPASIRPGQAPVRIAQQVNSPIRHPQSTPGGAGGHGGPGQPSNLGINRPRKRSRKKLVGAIAALIVVALIAWPVGLLVWANGKLNHIEALSGAANTPGTTYLIAGSDSREGSDIGGHVEGARADTIMLLHVPSSGPAALISLPRDIYVPIPGHNSNKINASFSFGGAPLLVQTVEELTGMTVDHYVEVGFQGVEDIVDAVGGVRLCYDRTVKDKESKLNWKAGCHEADGKTALAFSRMRKSDPLGDIGRAARQRQVVSAIAKSLKNPAKLVNPSTQVSLVNAGTGALAVSNGTGFLDLGKMALAFQRANSDKGITGTPPIISLNYRPGGVGSAVQIDEEGSRQFFADVASGALEPGEYNGLK